MIPNNKEAIDEVIEFLQWLSDCPWYAIAEGYDNIKDEAKILLEKIKDQKNA